MNFPFQKTISTVLIGGQISLMFTSISAYAKNTITPQEFGAQDAYILQKQTMNDLNNTHVVGKNITFGNSKVQESVNKDGPMITDDLTPTTAGKIPANKYYVNKKEPSTTNMQATYKLTDEGIDVLANQKKDNMDDDLKTDSATIESQAYSTIAKVAAQSKPINSNDPIFSKSNSVIETTNGNPFADCELDKKIIATKKTVHHSDFKECTEAPTTEKGCVLTHDFLPIIATTVGATGGGSEGNMYDTCEGNKENCVSIGFGKQYKNSEKLNSGSCASNHVETTIAISNSKAVRKATLKTVRFTGNVSLGFKSSSKTDQPLFSFNEGCTPNTEGKNYYMVDNVHHYEDVTALVKNSSSNVMTMFMDYTGAIPYVQMEVEYDPSLVVKYDEWTDATCASYAQAVHSGSLKGTVECTYYRPSIPTQDANATHVFLNGMKISKDYISSFAGLSFNCATAKVTVEPSQFKDKDGNATSLPSCDQYQKQGCSQSTISCEKYDSDNNCVLQKNIYDCGYDKAEDVPTTESSYNCPGAISCAGEDCVNIMVGDSSSDYTKALGLMQMTQQGTNDVDCTFSGDTSSLDPNKPLNEQGSVQCLIWKGEEKKCKIFYSNGGLGSAGNDCCDASNATTDIAQYIKNQAHMFKLEGVQDVVKSGNFSNVKVDLAWHNNTNIKPSEMITNGLWSVGWEMLVNFTGVGQKFQQITDNLTDPIVNRLNNLIPYAGDVFRGSIYFGEQLIINAVGQYVKQVVSEILSEVYKAVAREIATAFGSGAGGEFVKEGAKEAGKKVGETVAENGAMEAFSSFCEYVVPVIGWIYAIYKGVQMVINIATKCHDEDFELQNDIHLQKCDYVSRYCSMKNPGHFVGGFVGGCLQWTQVYCCFDSPLSRILNKQVRYAQRGCPNLWPYAIPACAFGFGEKHAICNGITLDEIEKVDWEKIDLTEWLNLLSISGMSPSEITNFGNGVDDFLPIGGRDQNGNKHDVNNQHTSSSMIQ